MTSVQRIGHILGSVGVTILMLWMARSIGPAGALVNLLVPLPVAFVHMRLGTLAGTGAVALVASTLCLLGVTGSALLYLTQFGAISFLLPLFLRRKVSWDRAVGATLIVYVGLVAVAILSYASYNNVGVGGLVDRYVHQEVESAMAVYEGSDLPPEQVGELRQFVEWTGDFMLATWPGLLVLATAVLLLLTVFFLGILAKNRYDFPGLQFSCWKTPEHLIWMVILAGFAFLFGQNALKLVAQNILTVLLPLYFLHGLAIVAFYFEKRSLAPFARALGYLLTLINPLSLIVTAMGVFDLWVDFRKPRIKKTT